MDKYTVLLAFLTRDHPFSVPIPSPPHPCPRPYGSPLPQRDSPF